MILLPLLPELVPFCLPCPTADAVGYCRTLLRSLNWEKSRSQPFAVRLVVAVPTAQALVAGVGEKKFQRRRFNVAVAK